MNPTITTTTKTGEESGIELHRWKCRACGQQGMAYYASEAHAVEVGEELHKRCSYS